MEKTNSDTEQYTDGSGQQGRPTDLKRWVAWNVRSMIMNGKLQPGNRIDQDELATSLGVSKLPVREALITLAADHLVEHIPRKGVYVAQLHQEDVLEHFVIYGALSGLAAGRAAKVLTKDDIDELKEIGRRILETGDPKEQEQLNHQLHATINKAGAGQRLRRVLKILEDTSPLRFYGVGSTWSEHLHVHHGSILKALEKRDSVAAEAAMREHLSEAGKVAVKALEDAGLWSTAKADEVPEETSTRSKKAASKVAPK